MDMGYGMAVKAIGAGVSAGINANTQNDLRAQQLAAYMGLAPAPDYQKLFQQGWGAQNAAVNGQAWQDIALRNVIAPNQQQQAFNLYSQYAPQYAQANLKTLKQVDPQYMQLYGELSNAVSNDLSKGTQLTPQQLAQANAYIGGAQAARGNVLGNAPVAAQALYDSQLGQQLYQQRIANAENLMNSGGPESRFGEIGGNVGQMSLGSGMQALTNPATEYYQMPEGWAQQYANMGALAWNQNHENQIAQAQAQYNAVPQVNPWLASMAAGSAALAGGMGGGSSSPPSSNGANQWMQLLGANNVMNQGNEGGQGAQWADYGGLGDEASPAFA
jgi:hypothetical protein